MHLSFVLFYFLNNILCTREESTDDQDVEYKIKFSKNEINQQTAIAEEKKELQYFLSNFMKVLVQNLILKKNYHTANLEQLFEEVNSKVLSYTTFKDNLIFYCSSSYARQPIVIIFPVQNDVIKSKIIYILNYFCHLRYVPSVDGIINAIVALIPTIISCIFSIIMIRKMSRPSTHNINKWISSNNLKIKKPINIDAFLKTYSKENSIKLQDQIQKWKINFIEYNEDENKKNINDVLLLYGPAGSGKTELGRLIYSNFQAIKEKNNSFKKNIVYLEAKGSDFGDQIFVGSGASTFEQFTNLVKKNVNKDNIVCIQIDEANTLIETRRMDHTNASSSSNDTKNAFLCFLDKYANDPNVFFLLTTNAPRNYIDESSVRRICAVEVKCHFSAAAITNIMENNIRNIGYKYPQYTHIIQQLNQNHIKEYSKIIYEIYYKKLLILINRDSQTAIEEKQVEIIINELNKEDYRFYISPFKIMQIFIARLLALNNQENIDIDSIDITKIKNIDIQQKQYLDNLQHTLTETEVKKLHEELLQDLHDISKY